MSSFNAFPGSFQGFHERVHWLSGVLDGGFSRVSMALQRVSGHFRLFQRGPVGVKWFRGHSGALQRFSEGLQDA